jgi:hypothetical protein
MYRFAPWALGWTSAASNVGGGGYGLSVRRARQKGDETYACDCSHHNSNLLGSAKGAARTAKPIQEPIAPHSVLREFLKNRLQLRTGFN